MLLGLLALAAVHGAQPSLPSLDQPTPPAAEAPTPPSLPSEPTPAPEAPAPEAPAPEAPAAEAPAPEAPAPEPAAPEAPAPEPPAPESPAPESPPVQQPHAPETPGVNAPGASPPPPPPAPVAPAPLPPPDPGPLTEEPPPEPVKEEPPAQAQPDEDKADDGDDGADPKKDKKKDKSYKKFKFFRFGFWPKFGYTDGTSQKNGIFDKEKTIENAMMGGDLEPVGGGNSTERFGGLMYGGTVDIEIFFANIWVDFQKFFNPGGMISLMLGYDHEFWPHRVVRIDLGAGFGFHRIFLGGPLEDLYYDPSNPEAVNIATAGIAGRIMTSLEFRLYGPLYLGPRFDVGYHYLFTANVDEVTKERGLHWSAAIALKTEFTIPRTKP